MSLNLQVWNRYNVNQGTLFLQTSQGWLTAGKQIWICDWFCTTKYYAIRGRVFVCQIKVKDGHLWQPLLGDIHEELSSLCMGDSKLLLEFDQLSLRSDQGLVEIESIELRRHPWRGFFASRLVCVLFMFWIFLACSFWLLTLAVLQKLSNRSVR
jgi:hypothetical protein